MGPKGKSSTGFLRGSLPEEKCLARMSSDGSELDFSISVELSILDAVAVASIVPASTEAAGVSTVPVSDVNVPIIPGGPPPDAIADPVLVSLSIDSEFHPLSLSPITILPLSFSNILKFGKLSKYSASPP